MNLRTGFGGSVVGDESWNIIIHFCLYKNVHFAKENPREIQFWNSQDCLLCRERALHAYKLKPLLLHFYLLVFKGQVI